MERDNLIARLSLDFALRIVKLRKYLSETKNEYILSKQILRSGTSIGANIYESEHAQSKEDFLAKLYISLKEANETMNWLNLLKDTGYMTQHEFDSMAKDCSELIALLVASIKTKKQNINQIKMNGVIDEDDLPFQV